MKWKSVFSAMCIILIGSTAYAAEETYIVQFNNQIQMFDTDSKERHESRNYTTATYEELQEYIDAGIVEYYEPDYEVELLETIELKSTTNEQWNLESIKISKPWNIGCYGNDVVVGVIDSGCYAHPDLKKKLLSGKNYTSSDIKDTDDNIGHGTFVSGIIAAECNGEYIDGIAHKAKIVPLKCFDSGVVTQTSMISNAIYDAVDLYGCDVINMSFGIPTSKITKTLKNAVNYAIQKNCILVAAVGNDGASTVYYPAKYDNVIGVGSVDKNGEISYFSQCNSTVDFVAPGQRISSISIDGYKGNSGTSFAAPHITALAAIAKCIDPDITVNEITDILIRSSQHPDDADGEEKKYDVYYGYGLVNAGKMIDELLKDEEVFLSPISITKDEISTVVYNNSDSILTAEGIVSNYTENVMRGCSLTELNILPGEYKDIRCELTGDKTKVMIWSGVSPLIPYREYIR